MLAGGRALTLVDDSYNANPDSVIAAIDVLAALPGPRLLVLGDMGEVGDQLAASSTPKSASGRASAVSTSVYTLRRRDGAHHRRLPGRWPPGRHFDEFDALGAAVLARLPQLGSVLVKGSRFMKMERVVQVVEARADHDNNNDKEAGHDRMSRARTTMLDDPGPMAADASRPSSGSCAFFNTSPSAP